MKIYSKNGAEITDIAINAGCVWRKELMTEEYVSLKFSTADVLALKKGCYIETDFGNGRYEIVSAEKPKFNTTTGGYDYEQKFHAEWEKWKYHILFYDRQGGKYEKGWSLTQSPGSFMSIVISNLSAAGLGIYSYHIEEGLSEIKNISFDGTSIFDALNTIAETWETEWWVEDHTIYLGKCEFGSAVDFEIGGAISDMQQNESDGVYATRIYVFGSTRNLPSNYRSSNNNVIEGVVERRLALPEGTDHIDAWENLDEADVVEAIIINDDIYPRRTGTISDISTKSYIDTVTNDDGTTTDETWYAYRFKDSALTFSERYILEGEELRIVFQSGVLAGLDFAVKFNPDSHSESSIEAQIFEIVRNEDYGIALPNDALHPSVGDTYILYGYDTSFIQDSLLALAEQELLQYGQQKIAELERNESVFSCPTDPVRCAGYTDENGTLVHHVADEIDLDVGQSVRLKNSVYFDEGSRLSRIRAFEKNLDDIFNARYEVGDSAKYSHLDSLESEVRNIAYKGAILSGGSNASTIALIKRYDNTKPTDYNVYSAARARQEFLLKQAEDTAEEKISFAKGIDSPDFLPGSTGFSIYKDGDNWVVESDIMHVRKKLTANEVAIQDVHHVGGQMLLTASSCTADFVIDKGSYYRVFFLRKDDDGNEIENKWRTNDQAYCQTFNLSKQAGGKTENHFFWRLVIGVSDNEHLDTETYSVDGRSIIASDYHYIDLSKNIAASYSDAPQAGDDIVQLGYRGKDSAGRQSAILIAGASADDTSPYVRLYEGINTFSLPSDTEQLKPGDNRIKGVLQMMRGSTLDDGRDVNALGTSRGNLLKNTGFTGDYESVDEEDGELVIDESTPIYSNRLKYWDATNVEVLADTDSASGYSAKLGVLSQTVDGGWVQGEWYMLSLRAAQGTLTIEAGGEVKVATLTDWERIDFPFQASTTDGVVRFSGTAKVCEIMLTLGNLPTEWHKASTDNDKSMAEYFGLDYLRKAITDATTNIIGGLVMTQILKVGNYRDGRMSEETGGMSGAYNDDKSPFLWGGGTMEDAIYTIMKYAKNPAYQPTEEEVARMAKFVVTHGGRAILNDIVLRGYIYALGGVFNGTVYAHDGEFSGEDGMYKLSLNAANRTISIYGPSLVDENGQPIEGAEQVLYAIIGGWSKRPSRKGFITAPNISMRALNASQETIQILGMDALNGFSILDANGNKLSGLSESIMGGSGINHFYLGNIPTSADSAATGEVYNDNGTLKIKS